jgi:hypothetical protein
MTLRFNPALAGAWNKLLLGMIVCLPVPALAASGLAVPLPPIILRVAVGLAERTQAVAVHIPGLEAVVAETADTTRTGSIKLSARERAISQLSHNSPTRTRPPARALGPSVTAEPARQPALHRAGEGKIPAAAGAAARPARRAHDKPKATASVSRPRPASERGGRVTEEPRSRPGNPERPEEAARPASEPRSGAPKNDPKNPPTDEPKNSTAEPTTPPNDAPTILPVAPIVGGVAPAPIPAPPPAVVDVPTLPGLQGIAADLAAIVADLGPTLGSKVAAAQAEVESAIAELAKTPPDAKAALGDLQGAEGDLEGAVKENALSPATGSELMDRIATEARLQAEAAIADAKSRGGDPKKIAEAEKKLAEGDWLRTVGQFKDAVGKYKDALSQADKA